MSESRTPAGKPKGGSDHALYILSPYHDTDDLPNGGVLQHRERQPGDDERRCWGLVAYLSIQVVLLGL